MTSKPTLTSRAEAQHAERVAREAEALRRNLLLRKCQARARAEPVRPAAAETDTGSCRDSPA